MTPANTPSQPPECTFLHALATCASAPVRQTNLPWHGSPLYGPFSPPSGLRDSFS